MISSRATAEDTSALIDIVAKFCVSRENFHQKYEAAIMDMIQCAFIRSEKEVVDGYILSDGEIVERLQSLSHMKEIDYWQIVGSVWAASRMVVPSGTDTVRPSMVRVTIFRSSLPGKCRSRSGRTAGSGTPRFARPPR